MNRKYKYVETQVDGNTVNLIAITEPKVTEAENFAKRYAINTTRATRSELERAIRKASKAANQRLLRLERAGYQTSTVYQDAAAVMGKYGKRRFPESAKAISSYTSNELRQIYKGLEKMLSSQTSTVSGQRMAEDKRYNTAVQKGYQGTPDQFKTDIARAFASSNEKRFGSDIVYKMVTTGTVDLLEEAIEESKSEGRKQNGDIYRKYLKKMRERKTERKRE